MIRQNIKTIFLLFFTILLSYNALSQVKKQISITGKVEFLNPEIFQKYNLIWLTKGIGSNLKTVDSTKINPDGTFSFKLNITKPGLYQLDVIKWQTITFWADNDINVFCRGYDTARIKTKNSGYIFIESNSEANQLINVAVYNRYLDKKLLKEVLDEGFSAQKYKTKDSTWFLNFRKQNLYRIIEMQSDDRIKNMISSYPENPAIVYLLSLLDLDRNSGYVMSELGKLLTVNSNFEEAAQLKKDILLKNEISKSTENGSTIPDFAYPGPNENIISLSSLKGKFVIVDFWASWCGPCRKSIPKLKELYTEYKSKGLEIISVSIDTDDDAWRKAMIDENMPWLQVLSPNKDKTLKDFNIQGVPTLFLIDRNGKIVEKFTGFYPKIGEILKAKL